LAELQETRNIPPSMRDNEDAMLKAGFCEQKIEDEKY
jgi:hypothetical protein